MVVIKNGHGLLGLGTLKSAVSQEWNNFFACWYKFMKAKSYLNNYWVDVVKNGQSLKIVGLLSQVYLTNDLINWADYWMIFACWEWWNNIQHYFVSLTFKCWGTIAVVLSQSFLEKFPLSYIDHKIGIFLLI